MILTKIILLTLMINSFLLIISLLMNLNKNKKHNMNQTNFECGFNEKTMLKIPFSTNFFMLTILFLIFDLEISLITPFIFMNNLSKIPMTMLMTMIISITIMLMNEWMIGLMEWTK